MVKIKQIKKLHQNPNIQSLHLNTNLKQLKYLFNQPNDSYQQQNYERHPMMINNQIQSNNYYQQINTKILLF